MGALSPVPAIHRWPLRGAAGASVAAITFPYHAGRADWQKTLDSYNVRTLVLNKEFR